ncbi:UDP-glycosyltransferase 75C1-like [Lolium perenne]|uniref:UDP-glycosyltransferase 75C1-like n=1 Tax=Lolium perenne TaxID=4522 RepID=UPI0021EB526C|nr:UDP-glycosyltransferase 75C1-like [Lolium perenne]
MARSSSATPHFLFVTTPMQGHINPARRLAARVLSSMPTARVTFSTAVGGHRLMFPSLSAPDAETVDDAGVLYAPYSDGYDEGFDPVVHGTATYKERSRTVGRETLSAVVTGLAARGRPVTRIVYAFLVPWAASVARAHGVPAALYWIQPAAVFAVYYNYFHGHDKLIASSFSTDATVDLPGLPPLKSSDLPSVVSITSPDHPHYLLLDMMRDLFNTLDEHKPNKVLVNTFDALEPNELRAVPQFELVAVGPVVPDDEASPSSADLFGRDDDATAYMEWLDTKPARSVVYVSFGTVFPMGKRQEEETRRGLEATGRPYLWVGRKGAGGEQHVNNGVVVEWCDQVKVLSHPAVGCFVTHCGWNSTLESVTRGVPMVAVPQWTDQPTVAWLAEARMGVAVRAKVDGEGVAERGELQRCVDTVMGDGEEALGIRAQADLWMVRANEAIAGGGTSERNLRALASEL